MTIQEVVLSAKQVNKAFIGENKLPKEVLRDVDLNVHKGEFVTILGQSGSGKSTLMRIFAGLIFPDTGTVSLAGKPIEGPNADISMVFQSYALYPWLTVYDNIAFGLIAQDLPPQMIDKKLKALLTLVGLNGYEKAWPRQLSGGMRQRVGFARALAVEPKVLLLDEPFSSLDIFTAQKLRMDLMNIWTNKKNNISAIIMVSHDIEEAVMMSDRVVIMDANKRQITDEIVIDRPRESRGRQNMAAIIDETSDRLYKRIAISQKAS
ncbi:ABC transporter ATP-binding protein [Serratia fonticola]|uniref:ABC transporter ATP-binding protein n=1 Tax=Serratia fonticola TaxID=47917 RepID=UPI000E0F1FED|nr:ABC transporter ATP-binding protein [Serratia fonticola]RDL28149.1 NitT/TauT family transport system ATP-binding protein [Serratia fonticola]